LRRAPADVLPGCRRRDVMVLLGDVAKTCQLNGVYIYIIYILSYYNVGHTIYIILYTMLFYILYVYYIYRLYEHID
jgi:hypothetical protein